VTADVLECHPMGNVVRPARVRLGIAVAVGGVAAAAAAVGWARRRWAVVHVDGVSMLPTLRHGDRVVVRRVAHDTLRTGQVVVLQRRAAGGGWHTTPLPLRTLRRDGWYIKRIVAAPGDPVPVEAAAVIGAPAGTPVPAGQLVLFGDNPAASTDSRHWGYAPVDRVLGVVVRRLDPEPAAGE
jgi:signal peptidase I